MFACSCLGASVSALRAQCWSAWKSVAASLAEGWPVALQDEQPLPAVQPLLTSAACACCTRSCSECGPCLCIVVTGTEIQHTLQAPRPGAGPQMGQSPADVAAQSLSPVSAAAPSGEGAQTTAAGSPRRQSEPRMVSPFSSFQVSGSIHQLQCCTCHLVLEHASLRNPTG